MSFPLVVVGTGLVLLGTLAVVVGNLLRLAGDGTGGPACTYVGVSAFAESGSHLPEGRACSWLLRELLRLRYH